MPSGHGDTGSSVLRGRGVTAEPVQCRDQPLAQPRGSLAATHVYREVEQSRCSVDVAMVTQQLIHVTCTLAARRLTPQRRLSAHQLR